MPQLSATAVLQLVLLLSALPAQYLHLPVERVHGCAALPRHHTDEQPPESLAIESMLYDNEEGYFGASKIARSPRPPYVFLRVGEVVMELKGNMIGVVVSWDPEMRAPPEWAESVYSSYEPDIPTLENYFTHFDGERFVMQPWLKKLYPEDAVEDV
ncbi:hypothetical protein E3U43_017205 [Larimichthys crocea]|uniref:Uncharacterized protein n=1 Tax=Larimichthys crocea TaxID=215358 RepID=A0ACD3QY23_LARCR|nr:hypothetical protein E3U43_017205 [Larimichthys crocea]